MPFTVLDRDRLISDPKAFMDGIAVMIAGECSTPSMRGTADLLTFVDAYGTAYKDVAYGDDFGSVRIPYLMLRKAKPEDTVTFPAYLIEFEAGKTPQTTLGTGASLAFTANMNGCTLGIGSQSGPGGSLLVTHSNAVGGGSQDGNTALQRQRAGAIVGPGGRLFEPEHYRTNDKQSITFGYREGGMWKFAFLSWKRFSVEGVNYVKSYGVQDVKTNRVSG